MGQVFLAQHAIARTGNRSMRVIGEAISVGA
jgi:hypothetical protein